MSDTNAGHGTGSDVFPVDGGLHRLEIRLRAIQLSSYPAGPAARRPVRLGTAAAFLACCGSLHLSDPGQPSDPGTLPPSSSQLSWGYTKAPRGASLMPPTGRYGLRRVMIEPVSGWPMSACAVGVAPPLDNGSRWRSGAVEAIPRLAEPEAVGVQLDPVASLGVGLVDQPKRHAVIHQAQRLDGKSPNRRSGN